MAPKPPPLPPRPWTPEMETDLQRILSVGEECISEKELKALILAKGRGIEEDCEFTTSRFGSSCSSFLHGYTGISRKQISAIELFCYSMDSSARLPVKAAASLAHFTTLDFALGPPHTSFHFFHFYTSSPKTKSPPNSPLRRLRTLRPHAHSPRTPQIRKRKQMHLPRHALHVLLLGGRLVCFNERQNGR